MPTVRTYGSPTVARAPLPNVRLTPDAPEGAFRPPAPIDISRVTQAAQGMWEKAKEEADQVAITDASSKLSNAETEFLYGQHGILNREGKDALGAQDELAANWDQTVSDVESGLTNDRQKAAFQGQVAERWQQINRQVASHVSEQTKKYDADTTESLIENEQDNAVLGYKDPERVAASVARQVSAITAFAARHGASDETLHASVSKAISATHVRIIDRMLANDEDQLAKQYYDAHVDQISSKNIPEIEKNLEEGSLRGNSQRQSDEIMKKAGSQSEADSIVKAISDPKLRDEVQKRVDYEFQKQRERQRGAEDDNFKAATNLLDRKKTLNPREAIPPSLWTTLTLGQRSALYSYAKDVVNPDGGEGTTNTNAWLDFMQMKDADVGKLTQSELSVKYLSKFGKTERNRAITRWSEAINAKASAGYDNPGLKPSFSLQDQVQNALLLNGSIPADKLDEDHKKLLVDTERDVEAMRARASAAKGKPLTSEEERQVVDDVVLRKAFSQPTGFRGDVRQSPLGPGKLKITNTDGTPRIPISQVPERRQTEIRQRIRGKITVDKIERAYAAFAIGDMAKFNAIMGEQ